MGNTMNAKKAAELIWDCWQNGTVIKNIPNLLVKNSVLIVVVEVRICQILQN